ncbi:MAG: hypothetical protein OHK0015_01050 [Chloroflexi bacterium OHK40]
MHREGHTEAALTERQVLGVTLDQGQVHPGGSGAGRGHCQHRAAHIEAHHPRACGGGRDGDAARTDAELEQRRAGWGKLGQGAANLRGHRWRVSALRVVDAGNAVE